MARDNDLYVCVVKPHGVSDKPLGAAVLHNASLYGKIQGGAATVAATVAAEATAAAVVAATVVAATV